MKLGFYPRLAFDGIRKNKRMYLPYIMTCVGMVVMHYIICSMKCDPNIRYLPGTDNLIILFNLGSGVIAVFACLFLFYTNAFLIRRRKKEFGLYNILGMGKRDLSRILVWESLMTFALSLVIGLIVGIALSKIAELGLVNMLKEDIPFSFEIPPEAVVRTVAIFAVIHVLLFINSVIRIRSSDSISLIKSENVGERPPKANWFLGTVGFIILAAAYYIAVTIKDPLDAMQIFFVAVIMVIIGTYLIMICGSVMLCRILQKRKKYYYRSNHFISVSSMTYRMKRNGAGLASICILATMVLVMLSSSASLFAGSEESLRKVYPRELNVAYRFESINDISDENIASLRNDIIGVVDSHGTVPQNVIDYRFANVYGCLSNDLISFDIAKHNDADPQMCDIYIVPLCDYNAMSGTDKSLEENEVMVFAFRCDFNGDSIGFSEDRRYTVKEHLKECFISESVADGIEASLTMIVPNIEAIVVDLKAAADNIVPRLAWEYYFDTEIEKDVEESIFHGVQNIRPTGRYERATVQSRDFDRQDFYSTYGGLFYLGIILSIVFVFSAILMIYYKQISEGYEDRSKFEIMQKVGLTKKEIRKSVNSQLLTIFFLPLMTAGLHLAFAFPIIERIIRLFGFDNRKLFALTTLSCFFAFSLLYGVVYRITSNIYYGIVSGMKDADG